jgi:hypothetical protein
LGIEQGESAADCIFFAQRGGGEAPGDWSDKKASGTVKILFHVFLR